MTKSTKKILFLGLFIGTLFTSVLAMEKQKLQPIPDEYAVAVNNVSCFWGEPITYGGKNFHAMGYAGPMMVNIMDRTASYWMSRFLLKSGDRLILKGEYSHARYNSIQSYGASSSTASLKDVDISPDKGSINPYIDGANRYSKSSKREYTITILNEREPEDKKLMLPNTLYAGPPKADPQEQIELRYRTYLADQQYDDAFDSNGGARLPLPVKIIHKDGSEEKFVCDRDPKEKTFMLAQRLNNSATPIKTWTSLWKKFPCSEAKKGEFCNNPWTAPAQNPPVFEKVFNFKYSIYGLFMPPKERAKIKPASQCGGAVDVPANFDNSYITAFLNNNFGKVVRITAKAPKTVKTYWNNKKWNEKDIDLRYWSVVTGNDLVTGQIASGVNDEMIPTLDDGTYSIIISKPEDRPKNATQACGHAWVDWGRRGDMAGRDGHTSVAIRHLLPTKSFKEASQNVCEAGTEEKIMGEYFPKAKYYADAKSFDAEVGCLSK